MTVPSRLVWVFWAALVAVEGQAADLTAIERRIAHEPSSTSNPRYCLLVFGPDAGRRIWLVQDGPVIYVDRNANGDLTEADERVAATPGPDTKVEDGVYSFELGDIRDGTLVHRNLRVQIAKLQRFAERDDEIAAYLESDPQARGYSVTAHVEMPGWTSLGLGGRVEQFALLRDARGFLRFADSPRDAPILHFGGGWQIALNRTTRLLTDRDCELVLGLGTPGAGPGTTVFSGYEGIVPPDAHPTVELTYPASNDGQPAIAERYELAERCCTINLYGFVRAPSAAASGIARASFSFDAWPAGRVAPTLEDIEIVATERTVLETLPVSSRLKGSLSHPDPTADVWELHFSPDGRRILSADYPSGVIHVWDVELQTPLARIETGAGYRWDSRHFFLTSDWRLLFSWHENGPQFERYEVDGKQMIRYEFESNVRVWDVETGVLRRTYSHDPPRGIRLMRLSPDGLTFMTLEELPGEYELGVPRTRSASLWNVETGESRPITDCGIFSPNGKTIAVALREGETTTAIQLLDAATLEEMLSIPIVENLAQASPTAFSPDGRLLFGSVFTRSERDSPYRSHSKVWDAETGRELVSLPDEEFGTQISVDSFSPDGAWCAAVNWQANDGRMFLLDLRAPVETRTIHMPEKTRIRGFAFSPDGQWLAALTQALPADVREDVTAEELPQPRIHLVDVATAEVRETLVAPPAIGASLCFSPDGQTLASSGQGRVLLWDLSTPPGSGAKPDTEIERHDR